MMVHGTMVVLRLILLYDVLSLSLWAEVSRSAGSWEVTAGSAGQAGEGSQVTVSGVNVR